MKNQIINFTKGLWTKQKKAFTIEGKTKEGQTINIHGIAVLDEKGSPIAYSIINREHTNGEASDNAKIIAKLPSMYQLISNLANSSRYATFEDTDYALNQFREQAKHLLK